MSPKESLRGSHPEYCITDYPQVPLSKREWFAGMAMQAVVQLPNPRLKSDYAREAVELADLLIAELAKEKNG